MDSVRKKYSVLMSVYYKEKAEYLRTAMESMWNQTIPTDDFVLVCDGPLTQELDHVIKDMEQAHPELHIIRLEENKGLGNALNIGIRQCKNELVARMDSDDISRANRCEKQLSVFSLFPEISICSGTVEEFSESRSRVEARRVLPEKQEDILAFAKKRNPFNHPCVMYKKSDVEAAGSYQVFYRVEDYYLWIRMLRMGFEGYNIQEPLLWMRAGSDMYKRRGGWKFAQSQIKLFRYMKDTSFINGRQYAENIVLRCAASVIPNALREKAFKMFVRN